MEMYIENQNCDINKKDIKIEMENETMHINICNGEIKWNNNLYFSLKRRYERYNGDLSDEEIINKVINDSSVNYIEYIESLMGFYDAGEYYDNNIFEIFKQLNNFLSNREKVKKMIQEFLESKRYIMEAILIEIQYGRNIPYGISRVEPEENEESKEYIDELSLEDLEELEDIVED